MGRNGMGPGQAIERGSFYRSYGGYRVNACNVCGVHLLCSNNMGGGEGEEGRTSEMLLLGGGLEHQ